MDAATIWTIATGLAGTAGGYVGGKVFGNSSSVETAQNVVELMKAEVDVLKQHGREKDQLLASLNSRVEVLESLVTQRAEVEAVHQDVREVKSTVDRIAVKVGA